MPKGFWLNDIRAANPHARTQEVPCHFVPTFHSHIPEMMDPIDTTNSSTNALATRGPFLNPVYDHSCPDPFVLKYRGEYWAYGSNGLWDGRYFRVLHSRDLVHWRELTGTLVPIPGDSPEYWAPEVTYDKGRFYLYYSVGDEEHMQMRVAVADAPAGPFIDSGHRLTTEKFAIDGHVFTDDDGARYFFYAVDFLEHSHIGTGTVRDRMLDLFTLEGKPRPVTRAQFDWQVYDPQRAEKGGVRWHTVEGPFVLKRKGIYYQMFSGGNWKNVTYGVSYARTDDIETNDEWAQACDGDRVLPILRTRPDKEVIGPGHNSVVRGPDNMQLYCVYHRWNQVTRQRVLAIDPLEWAGDRLIVLGPSSTPQPAPLLPTFADSFDEARANGLGAGWSCDGGGWSVREGAAIQQSLESDAMARCITRATHFVCEVNLRALEFGENGAFGVALNADEKSTLRFTINPMRGDAAIARQNENSWTEQALALPRDFDPRVFHLVRVEVDGLRVRVRLDGVTSWRGALVTQATRVGLITHNAAAAFAGFALTVGWEDQFDVPEVQPADLRWHSDDSAAWRIRDQQLMYAGARAESLIRKGPSLQSYLFVVNARLDPRYLQSGEYGFYPALGDDDTGPLLRVQRAGDTWELVCRDSSGARKFSLPENFDPSIYQHWRFRKEDGRLTIQLEEEQLGEIAVSREPTRVGLYVHTARAAFDLVRVTAISDASR